jgi:polyphosphate kinase
MHRNLDRRVEALVRVTLPSAQDDLRNVLELSMHDESEGWDLAGDGTWHRRPAGPTEKHLHLQEALLRRVIGKAS